MSLKYEPASVPQQNLTSWRTWQLEKHAARGKGLAIPNPDRVRKVPPARTPTFPPAYLPTYPPANLLTHLPTYPPTYRPTYLPR